MRFQQVLYMSKQQKKLSVSEEALKKAEELCEVNGLKLTKLRKQVLKLIWKKPGYVKAYDLLDELQKIDPSAKPPTIYRTLDFLMENGRGHLRAGWPGFEHLRRKCCEVVSPLRSLVLKLRSLVQRKVQKRGWVVRTKKILDERKHHTQSC